MKQLLESVPVDGKDRVIEELGKEFAVLNICDVMDWIYFSFGKGVYMYHYSFEEESEHLRKFCENFDLYYYGRCREDFNQWEGIGLAKDGGYRGVVLEDLS